MFLTPKRVIFLSLISGILIVLWAWNSHAQEDQAVGDCATWVLQDGTVKTSCNYEDGSLCTWTISLRGEQLSYRCFAPDVTLIAKQEIPVEENETPNEEGASYEN